MMNPLMLLMSGCFGGFGSGYGYGMSANTMGTMMDIWGIAGMQTAMQCGMPGALGGMYSAGYAPAAGGRTYQTAPSQDNSSAALKQQMDAAYDEYEKYINLCSKIAEYEADTTTKAEDLTKAVSDAEINVLNKDKDLGRLLSELKTLQDNPLLDVKKKSKLTPAQQLELNNLNKAIQDKQAEIQNTEADKLEAQKKLEEAKQNLDAFNIAKSEDKKLRDEIFAKKEQVYKLYTELSAAYASALARERSEEAVVHDRAADARESGKWWDRTVLNPTNWFNKKGGFWGETTDNADVAKCLRKLKKSGRSEALAYAVQESLITVTNGVASTTHSELQGLVDLYNGKDPVAADPLNS